MESTLHRQLKDRYGPEIGGRAEVVLGPYRVDALGPDGRAVEIQSSPLGLLRGKLAGLLPTVEVVVVKPIVVGRRVIRRARPDGPDLGARRSPKRGDLLDAFDELAEIARIFPDPRLRIEILAVEVDEVRVPRRRRPGYAVVDRILREVVDSVQLREADDLWSLLPADLPGRFTTVDLGRRLGRSDEFARRVAYCLRLAGAARVIEHRGRHRVYERSVTVAIA